MSGYYSGEENDDKELFPAANECYALEKNESRTKD